MANATPERVAALMAAVEAMTPRDRARFHSHVRVSDRVFDGSPCHKWTGARLPQGYGEFHVGRIHLAHRVAFVMAGGVLIAGYTIDHLCRNRACVNARHLEQVTQRVNTLRGVGPTALNAAAGYRQEIGPDYPDRYILAVKTFLSDDRWRDYQLVLDHSLGWEGGRLVTRKEMNAKTAARVPWQLMVTRLTRAGRANGWPGMTTAGLSRQDFEMLVTAYRLRAQAEHDEMRKWMNRALVAEGKLAELEAKHNGW